MNKKSGKGLKRLHNALSWSMAGLKATFLNEKAFQQEVALCALLLPVGLWYADNGIERALLGGSLFLVLIVEVVNSAIEAVVDRHGEQVHILAGRAKDMGSAAVFLSLVNTLLVWFFVLFT